METFQADNSETIQQFVNKYPLTVNYFQQQGLPEDGFDQTLEDFSQYHRITVETLEEELQQHLVNITQPEEECNIPCLPGFCLEQPFFWVGTGITLGFLTLGLYLFLS